MAEQTNPRDLVLDILLAVNRDGEFSHIAVRAVLDKYRYLPRRDRAFIKRVSEGSIERQLELDDIIDTFSKTKVKKMKPVIRAILESAVYQLKYMDAVPDSAVCNEAVKLAKKRGFAGLAGFVNGVLRNLSRNLKNVEFPSMETEPVRALSVRYSMPGWIVEKWLAQFGIKRCERILAAFLEKHKTCVRVNTAKCAAEEVRASLTAQGISVEPVCVPFGEQGVSSESGRYLGDACVERHTSFSNHISEKKEPLTFTEKEFQAGSVSDKKKTEERTWATVEDAFYIENYDVLDEIPEFASGILYAQDVSSMMVARLAADGISACGHSNSSENGMAMDAENGVAMDAQNGMAMDVQNSCQMPGDCGRKKLGMIKKGASDEEKKQTIFALDVCAAPGGKSIHLAQLLAGGGHVEARDLTEYKVSLIEENKERCGVDNLSVKVWDATEYDAEMEAAADIVIADLPCSGLGVIGGKTDIKYKASPEKIAELAQLQRQILSVVKRYVKPGGILIYSTCTITEEENQQNLAWFLEENPQFVLEYERQFLPDEGCDGFYIARLRLAR